MFSLDPSTMNIVLTVTVVTLFIGFITLLIKLKPSTEAGENPETEIEVEVQKPFQNSPIVHQTPPLPAQTDVPPVVEKPFVAVSPTIGGGSVQAKQEAPMLTLTESKEIPKQEKTMPVAKTGPASSKRDCFHHFGYLRTFPKNSPIPDECFGCEKIVDCLVAKKSKSDR